MQVKKIRPSFLRTLKVYGGLVPETENLEDASREPDKFCGYSNREFAEVVKETGDGLPLTFSAVHRMHEIH